MEQGKRNKMVGYGLAVVITAVAAGGLFYFLGLSQGTRQAIKAKQSAAESRKEVQELREEVAEMTDRIKELEATSTTLGAGKGGEVGGDSSKERAGTTESSYTYLKAAYQSGGRRLLEADYVQMFTGEAAAKARIASGDCKGTVKDCLPENDYYISNVNPKVRTLALSSEAKIEKEAPGTKDPDGSLGEAPLSWSTLTAWHPKGKSTNRELNLYKVKLEDGVVTSLTLIYLP